MHRNNADHFNNHDYSRVEKESTNDLELWRYGRERWLLLFDERYQLRFFEHYTSLAKA
jgi:hypothetical protein